MIPRFAAASWLMALSVGLGVALPAHAQDTLSFATVDVAVGVSTSLSSGAMGAQWRRTPGPLLALTTPYGPGVLRFSLEVSRLRGGAGLPDLLEVFPTVEWGGALSLPRGVRASAVGGIGALVMHVEQERNPTEIEMALTATMEVRSGLGGAWSVGTGATARRVLLSRPLNQTGLFVTLGRRVRVPPGIRKAAASPALPPLSTTPRRVEGPSEAGALESGSSGHAVSLDLQALRDRGVLRLAEILEALPAWERSTVDHRTFRLSAPGLLPLAEGRTSILIDGIPVPVQLLGSTTLDRLPLGVETLGSIESVTVPGLIGGQFVDGGLLALRTRLPSANGLEVYGGALAENPTGDPGYLLYTDSTVSNVDKLGTGYEVGARWRLGAIGGAAGFRYSSDLVTDARLNGRTLSLRDPRVAYPVIRTRAPWVSLRLSGGEWGEHELRAGGSSRMDYFFLPSLGFEVPTQSTLHHVGAAGTMAATATIRWTYRAHAGWNRLERSPNYLDLDFDLATRSLGGQTALGLENRSSSLWVGGGIDDETAESGLLPSDLRRTTARGYVSGSIELGEARLGVDAELRRSEGTMGSAVGLRGSAPLGSGATARWIGWRVRSAGQPLDHFWALHGGGYGFLEGAGVQVEVQTPPRPYHETGIRVEVGGVRIGSVELVPFARVSSVEGMTLARASYVVRDRRPRPAGPVTVDGSASSGVVVAGIEGRWEPSERFRAESRYRWSGTVSGEPEVRDASRALPAHRFTQRIVWAPRGDLRLAFVAEGSSATIWTGYLESGGERIPSSLMTSAWLEKALWEGRVSLYARLRDLLDQHRPLHPLGAAPGLSFAVGASARLGTSAEPSPLR
jgi:hypothetical protein